MTVVNVHEAKTRFSHYIDRAHAGEEIVIAKAGKPHARIVALSPEEPKTPRTPGGWKGRLTDAFWEPLPEGWDGR